jgi:hypothetical protein
MPWIANDRVRIIRYEAYSLGTVSEITTSDLYRLVQDQLNDITDEGIIVSIQTDLTELDRLDLAIGAEQGSSNAALIKAGSLEWESASARQQGFMRRFGQLRNRVARLLSRSFGGVSNTGWNSQSKRG